MEAMGSRLGEARERVNASARWEVWSLGEASFPGDARDGVEAT